MGLLMVQIAILQQAILDITVKISIIIIFQTPIFINQLAVCGDQDLVDVRIQFHLTLTLITHTSQSDHILAENMVH